MRWPVLIQAAIGVFALFGLAYLAIDPRIGPIVKALSSERAVSNARVAALEVERAWGHSRRALERAAAALARSPTFQSMGEALPEDRRTEGLEQALEGALKQLGGQGRAALVDREGKPLAGAALLAGADAVRDAQTGAASVRVETLSDSPYEVVAVPVYQTPPQVVVRRRQKPPPPSTPVIVGALALARPLDRVRLGAWTRGLPSTSIVAILDGTEPVVSLRPFEQIAKVRPERLPSELTIEETAYAVSEIRLPNDRGNALRVVAMSPIDDPYGEAVLGAIRLLVICLAGVSFLLTAALVLAPVPTLASPAQSHLRRAPDELITPSHPDERLVQTIREPNPPLASGSVPTAQEVAFRNPLDAPSSVLKVDPLGTYSGVPSAAAETLPSKSHNVDVTPHSSIEEVADPFGASMAAVASSVLQNASENESRESWGELARSPEGGSHNTGQVWVPPSSAVPSPRTPASDMWGTPMSSWSSDILDAPRQGGGFDPVESGNPTELQAAATDAFSSGGHSAFGGDLSNLPQPSRPSAGLSHQRSRPGESTGFTPHETPLAPLNSTAGQHLAPLGRAEQQTGRGGRAERPAPVDRSSDLLPDSSHGFFPGGTDGLVSSLSQQKEDFGSRDLRSSRGAAGGPPPLPRLGSTSEGPTDFGLRSEAPPSFEALALAAQSTPPSIPEPGSGEDLPVPKGGLSPGMIAGQGLAQQGPVMAPSPRLEGNLPLPKEQAPHLYDLSPQSDLRQQSSDVGYTPGSDRTRPTGSPGLSRSHHGGRASGSSPSETAQPFDADHYRAVFDEFVAAKSQLGESVEGLSFEGFGAKLRSSEENLIEQHGCRAVRFQVILNDRSVSLRPQLVR